MLHRPFFYLSTTCTDESAKNLNKKNFPSDKSGDQPPLLSPPKNFRPKFMPSDFALVADECGTFCFLKGSKSFLQERSRFLSCVAANWTTKLLGDSVGPDSSMTTSKSKVKPVPSSESIPMPMLLLGKLHWRSWWFDKDTHRGSKSCISSFCTKLAGSKSYEDPSQLN